MTKFFVWLPRGWRYSGGRYPSCSRAKIYLGPDACPKGSIVGGGSGTWYFSTIKAHFRVTVVNGGTATVYFYWVMNNPQRVRQVVIGRLEPSTGSFAYKLAVRMPDDLRVDDGIAIELTYLKFAAGHDKWLATTSCIGGRWPFMVKSDYEDPNSNATGSASSSTSANCVR